MTATTGDSPAFFRFKEAPENSYLRIVDLDGNVGEYYVEPVTGGVPTLKSIADDLLFNSALGCIS